jgi:hypothetical protein
MTGRLWPVEDPEVWTIELSRYEAVIASQKIARLPELDAWYRDELPVIIAHRKTPHVTHAELVRVTEWKMTRGIWRARNLALVQGNDAGLVERASTHALAGVPHPTSPITGMAELAGVGPATASAIAAAAAPQHYAFFDELVAAQVPGLGDVTYTIPYYARYNQALRERARQLGAGWTPMMAERALWAHAGGKKGVAAIR